MTSAPPKLNNLDEAYRHTSKLYAEYVNLACVVCQYPHAAFGFPGIKGRYCRAHVEIGSDGLMQPIKREEAA